MLFMAMLSFKNAQNARLTFVAYWAEILALHIDALS